MNRQELTVNDFFTSKEITAKEIKDQFHLVAEYDIDMIHHKGCPHCKDTANQYGWKSESWTGVIWCIACGSIILTFFQDRMGGIHRDKVMVYEQRSRPMYRMVSISGVPHIICRYCDAKSSDEEDIRNFFCKECNKSIKGARNE